MGEESLFNYRIEGLNSNTDFIVEIWLLNDTLKISNNRAYLFYNKLARFYGADVVWVGSDLYLNFDLGREDTACEIIDKYLLVEELKK